MKVYVVSNANAQTDLWQQKELHDPKAGPGQVVIRVMATSLNYRDLMMAKNKYGSPVAGD